MRAAIGDQLDRLDRLVGVVRAGVDGAGGVVDEAPLWQASPLGRDAHRRAGWVEGCRAHAGFGDLQSSRNVFGIDLQGVVPGRGRVDFLIGVGRITGNVLPVLAHAQAKEEWTAVDR